MEKVPKKVFILDDDERFLDETSTMLREAGYEVLGCARVAESLGAIREFQPDCMMLDLKMPLFNGHDFLPWLRCQCPDLPIIICTGTNEVYKSILTEFRVHQVLHKPFGHEELFEALDRASETDGEPYAA